VTTTLLETLREKLTEYRRAHKPVEMGVLQVVLGDASMHEARTGKQANDDEVEKLIRKTLLGNQETMTILEQRGMTSSENYAKLSTESALLKSLLPPSLTVEEIVAALDDVNDAIKGAKNDGQATGVAMKHLKSLKVRALGDDVSAAVKKIRG
jgi:uncharacterized protein YqeY